MWPLGLRNCYCRRPSPAGPRSLQENHDATSDGPAVSADGTGGSHQEIARCNRKSKTDVFTLW